MIRLHWADLAVIGLYLIFTVIIGLGLYRPRKEDTEEFLLAGRQVTLPAFVATLVATWYGGILGVGEFSYNYGLASWTVFGLPYYVFALVFAFFLAGKVRQASLYTIPDRLAVCYGKTPAVIGSVLAFIMVSPAPYALMLGTIISLITEWNSAWCLVFGTVLSTFYAARGGFRTDVRVNVFQFALMFCGFGILLPMAVFKLGGWQYLSSRVPPVNLTWTGGNSPQVMVVWFMIALWTLVDPGFHQRCYAAKSPSVARNGILVSICFWFLFDFLTCFTGLYARAALGAVETPALCYPLLAEKLLPAGIKGLFYVGLLATVMSTALSYTFLGAVTVGRDIIWRLREESDESRLPTYTRYGLALTAAVAVALALRYPSVVSLWYKLGNICVPGLLIPVAGSYLYSRTMTSSACIASMIAGFGISLSWMIWGEAHARWGCAVYPLGLEPMIPGLIASTLVFVVGPKQQDQL